MDARKPVRMKMDLSPRREAKKKASAENRKRNPRPHTAEEVKSMNDAYDKRMGGRVSDRDYRKAIKKYQRKTMRKYK